MANGKWIGNAPSISGTLIINHPEAAGDPHVQVVQYFKSVRRHWLMISVSVLACVGAAVFLCSRVRPSYEATATVDVDGRAPTGLLGLESSQAGADNQEAFLGTQVRIIQSDAVLRPVAEHYKLIDPAARPDAPVYLPSLSIVRPAATYLIQITFRSPDRQLSADVANGIAQSYLDRVYETRHSSATNMASFGLKELDEVKARMERSTAELARFERDLNVIDPQQKTSMVSARLIQLNTEYSNAQADRLKKQAAYESIRSGTQEAAEVSTQGEGLRAAVEHLHQAQEKFNETAARYGANHPEYLKAKQAADEARRTLEEWKQNVQKRVAAEYQQAVGREGMLQAALAKEKAQADKLNVTTLQYQALREAAEEDRKLYEELQRRVKEATINASFRNSSIRLADMARPPDRPAFPNVRLSIALALLLSLGLGVIAAIIYDSFDDRIHEPDQITRLGSGPGVSGALPKVRARDARVRLLEPSGAGDRSATPLLAFENATRALRLAILRGGSDYVHDVFPHKAIAAAEGVKGQGRSLLVTSPMQSDGKTTVAASLALASARQGCLTLLIDASLERPAIHQMLGIEGAPGLAETLARNLPWRDAVSEVPGVEQLHVLPAGEFSVKAWRRLGGGIGEILAEASARYDMVILDSPALGVSADGLQIATLVNEVLVVARAGRTRQKELDSSLEALRSVHATVSGIVLNGVGQRRKQGHAPLHPRRHNTANSPAPVQQPANSARSAT